MEVQLAWFGQVQSPDDRNGSDSLQNLQIQKQLTTSVEEGERALFIS